MAVFRTAAAQIPGEVLPQWTPGTLDIHQISTGRGNCALFIFPDGTSMLVDAGALTSRTARHVPSRPDESRTPGEWITRYVNHMLGPRAPVELNYVMLTHFHGDHMGQPSDGSTMSKSGTFRLAGITEVGEHIPIRKILDRGWPDYDFPVPLQDSIVRNYRAFLEWHSRNSGLIAERFQPGRNDQIVPVHSPAKYPEFQVRNIMANGEVWTGVAAGTRRHLPNLKDVPKEDWPTENMCSAGMRISYGKFDYYTGGDIPGIPFEGFPLWHDIETPVAQAVGPVDAALLNHHGYIDSMNAFFISTLRPRVWILNVWESAHPTARVYSRLQSTRLYPGPRDIFATSMHEANRQVVVGLDKLASSQGHVVLRVAPGGDSFRILILDDSAETFRIKSLHGPYESR
jgi:hypothetical protein